MNGDERTPQSFSWMRRWGAGLNLLITVAAVVAIAAMVNYLAVRHYTRFHWHRDTESELSRRTQQVLASLTNTVKVTVYFDSDDSLFPRVKGLLKEYEFSSPHIGVNYVDYLRDGAAARLVKEQYNLNAITDKNVVIFESHGGVKVVNSGELSDYDYSKLVAGQTNEVERTHFKGEMLFTSAIFAVANERKPVAYFLIGNGEHPPEGADSAESYAKFAALLKNENNFELRYLLLGGTNDVPSDCNLLVVAGPTKPIDSAELDKIQRYLEQGGRMLATFNTATVLNGYRTGLERLLLKWGVEVGQNFIVDRDNSISGSELALTPAVLGQHPIVNPLVNSRVALYMPRSIRALRPVSRNEELRADELLLTGPKSITMLGLRTADPTQSGSKPLMVAVEKSAPALQRGSTRIAVLGDSMVWGNQLIEAVANRDFASSTVNWLVNQNVLLGDIAPRPIRTYQLSMTRAQLRSVQIILMAGLPAGVLAVGLLVWVRRRN